MNHSVKFCYSIVIIVVYTPIIFCDLYYGFTDISCINEMPYGLNYTMKLYLLVSGFSELLAMVIAICIACLLSHDDSKNEKKLICAKFTGIIGVLFQIIWNVLGAATFWGTIYREGICNSMISTYIYVSLIIKLVSNLFNLRQILEKI